MIGITDWSIDYSTSPKQPLAFDVKLTFRTPEVKGRTLETQIDLMLMEYLTQEKIKPEDSLEIQKRLKKVVQDYYPESLL